MTRIPEILRQLLLETWLPNAELVAGVGDSLQSVRPEVQGTYHGRQTSRIESKTAIP